MVKSLVSMSYVSLKYPLQPSRGRQNGIADSRALLRFNLCHCSRLFQFSFRSTRRNLWRLRTSVSGWDTTPALAPTTCTRSSVTSAVLMLSRACTRTWLPGIVRVSGRSTYVSILQPFMRMLTKLLSDPPRCWDREDWGCSPPIHQAAPYPWPQVPSSSPCHQVPFDLRGQPPRHLLNGHYLWDALGSGEGKILMYIFTLRMNHFFMSPCYVQYAVCLHIWSTPCDATEIWARTTNPTKESIKYKMWLSDGTWRLQVNPLYLISRYRFSCYSIHFIETEALQCYFHAWISYRFAFLTSYRRLASEHCKPIFIFVVCIKRQPCDWSRCLFKLQVPVTSLRKK